MCKIFDFNQSKPSFPIVVSLYKNDKRRISPNSFHHILIMEV